MPLNYNIFSQAEPAAIYDPVAERQRRQQTQEGQMRLRDVMAQRQREDALRPALADYASGNKARLADIIAVDPEYGMKLQAGEQEAAAKAQEQARGRQQEFMRLFYGVQDEGDYQRRRQIASTMFTPDELDDLPDAFDAQTMRALDAIADNAAVDDNGMNLTQRRGLETYKTDESIRGNEAKVGQKLAADTTLAGINNSYRMGQIAYSGDQARATKATPSATDRAKMTAPGTGGKPLKLTEDQGKNTGYYGMASQALSVLNKYRDWVPGEAARMAYGVPGLERALSGKDRRILSAQEAFTEAALRAATGAAYTKEEIRQNVRVYFPVPGDDAATIADKAAQRQMALQGMRTRSGPGAATVRTITPTPRQDRPADRGPKPGTVQDGYRFKGGDPANPRAWVKVS